MSLPRTDTEKLEEAKVIIADLIRYWMDNKGWFSSTEKARKFLREANELPEHN